MGNKCDLKDKKVISYKRAKNYADSIGVPLFETSSKLNINIQEAFYELTKSMALQIGNVEIDIRNYCNIDNNKGRYFANDDDGSDNESFSDEELDEDLDELIHRKEKKKEKKMNITSLKKQHARTNVNVCTLTMANLVEEKEQLTGDPIFCKHCGVIFNSYSKIESNRPKNEKMKSLVPAPPIHPELEKYAYLDQPNNTKNGESYWNCEFCMGLNIVDIEEEEIPKTNCMDYIAIPPPEIDDDDGSYSNIIFCIDTSGSMCVTSELTSKINIKGKTKREENIQKIRNQQQDDIGDQFLPGQKRNVSFVSRLQCVQSAVEYKINHFKRENPSAHIGLVTFNNEVQLIGDGTQPTQIVAGDRLYEWDQLQEIGNEFKISKAINESEDVLLDKLWDLEECGATALGPALQLSIAIAGSKPGSHVILCTDGLANVGLGSLEGKESDYTPYYTELAEQAKLKGVTVSVISLIGSECCLENLSIVTDQSGGIVTRVDPLQLENELSTIPDCPIIGYTTMAMVILHRGLRFQNEMDDEKENRNWIVKDLGNVRADTELSFQYTFRSKEECDLSDINEIPFQVQLMYTKSNGAQCIRIASATISVTDDRSVAEKNANLDVIGTHAAQRAAHFARGGDYERAQMETRSAQRFMVRNGVKQEKISIWSQQVNGVDNAVRNERKRVNQPGTIICDESVAAFEQQKKKRTFF